MDKYYIYFSGTVSDGACMKCGCMTRDSYTLSFKNKQKTLLLCKSCHKKAVKEVDRRNQNIESTKNINKISNVNVSINSSTKEKPKSEKTFDIDDPDTYQFLNSKQREFLNSYQSQAKSEFWEYGLEIRKVMIQQNLSDETMRMQVLKVYCDTCGWYWWNYKSKNEYPIDVEKFGYMKKLNLDRDSVLLNGTYGYVFTKYDNLGFEKVLDDIYDCLKNCQKTNKNLNVFTFTMLAANILLRSRENDNEAYDNALLMLRLANAISVNQNRELYEASRDLWAITAATIDFEKRAKRIISEIIKQEESK